MVKHLTHLILAIMLAIPTSAIQAQVISLLSSEAIEELESVRLAIRHVGTRQSESLDLSVLNKDFHVMGTNTSSQYQYVNGQAESWVDYQITLQPKRAGNLIIPPIKVGNERTKAMQLEVRKLTDSARAKINALIFYEQEFSNDEVYVQSQLLMTRKLYYLDGVQLYGGQPGAPEVDDALVVTLGENKNTSEVRNGKSYGVIEQRYAIFPQSSGELLVPPIQLSASVRLIDRGRASRKAVRVSTQSQQINVLPIPQDFPKDQPWLPALDLTLEQKIGTGPAQIMAVGENFSRVVELNVYGNTGAVAPPLLGELDERIFKQYPEPATIEDDINGSTTVGIRSETTDIVAVQPGTHVIPGIEIYWWDTQAKEVKQTKIETVVLTVEGQPLAEITQINPVTQAPPVIKEFQTPVMRRTLDYRDNLGAILLGLVFLVVLWRLILWFYQTSASSTQSSQLRKAKNAYIVTLRSEDLDLIRASLLQYLALYFNTSSGESWHKFMQSSPAARAYGSALDAAKYSVANTQTHWNKELQELGGQAIEQLDGDKTDQSGPLPALFAQY